VIETFIAGISAEVVERSWFDRIAVSPVHMENCWPAVGGSALTVTLVPSRYVPSPLPLFTVSV
jgi:hypothetical protein